MKMSSMDGFTKLYLNPSIAPLLSDKSSFDPNVSLLKEED